LNVTATFLKFDCARKSCIDLMQNFYGEVNGGCFKLLGAIIIKLWIFLYKVYGGFACFLYQMATYTSSFGPTV